MNKIDRIMLFFWMALFSVSAYAATIPLISIQVASYTQDTTNISIDLKEETHYHYFFLANPARFVIDFDNTRTAIKSRDVVINSAIIQNLRFGKPEPGTFRLVFDLKQRAVVNHAFFEPRAMAQKRLFIQLGAKTRTAGSKEIKKVIPKPVATLSTTREQPALIDTPSKKSGRDVIVVIDAGHGGKDPGAMGRDGTQEKEVVLAIAKELQFLISKQPGMQAVMTREGNYYVNLRARLQKARKNKADIFVAIHADAFKNSHSAGASVFALSLKGASSEAARWLAEKENYSELGGVDLDGKNDLLRSVLIDLSQTATISASLELGDNVLQELSKVGKLHYRKVEQAPFVVLKSPDIPSILVETGFLSNPHEESKLRSPQFQKQVAYAVMKGIRDYFYAKPPPGTKIAALRAQNKHYVVAYGDTLSTIAERFNMSVHALKSANHLTQPHIEVGQRLVIP